MPRQISRTTLFDQRGQTVTTQYNYAFGVPSEHIDGVQALCDELKRLIKELAKGHIADAISDEQAMQTKALLHQALTEAEAEKPDKVKLTDTMTKAAGALKGIASVAGLYEAIAKLAEHIPTIRF